MKAIICAFVLLVLVLTVNAEWHAVEEKVCGRTFTVLSLEGGYTFILKGIKACNDTDTGRIDVAALSFGISSVFVPYFALRGFKAVADQDTEIYAAAADLLFDQLIEYENSEGGAYRPPSIVNGTLDLGDKVNRRDILGSFLPRFYWEKISHEEKPIDETNIMHVLSFKENWFNLPNENIKYSVEITPVPLADGRKTLNPNSFKLAIDISNIKYSSQQSTGIALGCWLVTRAGIAQKEHTNAMGFEEEVEEEEVDIQNEDGDTEAQLKWNNTIIVNGTAARVRFSGWSVGGIANDNPNGYNVTKGWKLHRIWFSIPGRPNSVSWDPTLGVPESGAAALRATLTLFAVALLLFLLL